MEHQKLQPNSYFIDKIIQLYEMILVRHGLMVVGLTNSSKTSALNVLKETLTLLFKEELMEEMEVKTITLNPKSIKSTQLYGSFDDVSHEWTDGILAVS